MKQTPWYRDAVDANYLISKHIVSYYGIKSLFFWNKGGQNGKGRIVKGPIEEIFAGTSVAASVKPIIFDYLETYKVVDAHVVRDACMKLNITLSGKEIQSVLLRYEALQK